MTGKDAALENKFNVEMKFRESLEMKYKETLGISKENEAMAEKPKSELDNLKKKDLCLEKEKVTSIDFIKRLTNYDRGFQNRRLKKMIN